MVRLQLALLLLLISACAGSGASTTSDGESTISPPAVTEPASTVASRSMTASHEVDGETVTVMVEAKGFVIEFDRLDTSGRTAHVHLFIDRDPPNPGDVVALGEDSIVHSATDTLVVTLDPGDHVLWVVAADGPDHAVIPPEPVLIDVTIPG